MFSEYVKMYRKYATVIAHRLYIPMMHYSTHAGFIQYILHSHTHSLVFSVNRGYVFFAVRLFEDERLLGLSSHLWP